MKCLTVRQPFASFIASGRKTIEVRSWGTDYRGHILIHAASKWFPGFAKRYARDNLPRGVTLCVVELLDVRPYTSHDGRAACVDWRMPLGSLAWVLGRPSPVRRIAMAGQTGLFNPPEWVVHDLT